nr:hypothetical protein [Mycobacterium leprae]
MHGAAVDEDCTNAGRGPPDPPPARARVSYPAVLARYSAALVRGDMCDKLAVHITSATSLG